MGTPRSRDEKILEAMEACRPHGRDMADPAMDFLKDAISTSSELAQYQEALQQADAALVESFQDVPVPAGLEERLLSRLKVEADASTPRVEVPTRGGRRWAVISAAVVLAGSILLAVAWWPRVPSHTLADFQHEAIELFDAEMSVEPGALVSQVSPPQEFPLSPAIVTTGQTRWRSIQEFLETQGVAYDLVSRSAGLRATLYVVRSQDRIENLPSRVPTKPALMTRNRSVAAWQSQDLVYILVVEGGADNYRRFLGIYNSPLT